MQLNSEGHARSKHRARLPLDDGVEDVVFRQ